jgi:hypothetical protein
MSSPVTSADLDLLLDTLLWTDADERALQRALEVLTPQVDDVLDLWYGYVGSKPQLVGTKPQLVGTFAGPNGKPDAGYLTAVRTRFGDWILELCSPPYDQDWLDHQQEIALRHHFEAKNRTDGVDSPSDHVPLRYVVALKFPITATVREFLAKGASDEAELDAMHTAWFKAVVLTVVLWSRPYVERGW